MNTINRSFFRSLVAASSVGVVMLFAWALFPIGSARSAIAEPESGSFELLVVKAPGGKYTGVRFNRKTGETWSLTGLKWRKLEEKEVLPAGEYEVTVSGSGADCMTSRIERTKGTTWFWQIDSWAKVDEP